MRVLVFDTETTGLPKSRWANYRDSDEWPYIVQLSYILYNANTGNIEIEEDNIIKMDDGVHIPESSTKIHGISNEISAARGIPIKDAIRKFLACFNMCDVLVAHNIKFDRDIILAESWRNKIRNPFKHVSPPVEFCTMKHGKELCNIRQQNIYTGEICLKPPKLVELYEKLFNETPSGLHNSMIDVFVCLRCYFMIVGNIDICKSNTRIRKFINKL